jgi:ribosomal protein S3AE
MGIEPTSSTPQVFEATHRSSSIWAHLGAEFWPQELADFVHCVSLRIADHVPVDSQRDSRIRVSHLRFRDRRIRSYFHQQTRVAMSECVHSRAFDSKLVENGPKAVFDNLVRGVRPSIPVQEQKGCGIRFPCRQILVQQRAKRASDITTGARLALLFTVWIRPYHADRRT